MYQFGFLVLCVLLLILNNLNKIVKCESEKSTQRGEHDRGGWDGKPTFHFILYAFNAKEFIFINFSHPTSRSRDFVYFLHFNFQPTLQIPYKNVKKFNIQHFFGRNQIWIFIFKHCAFIIIIFVVYDWCMQNTKTDNVTLIATLQNDICIDISFGTLPVYRSYDNLVNTSK